MNIWLDDLREPPAPEYSWVKSVEELEVLIRQCKLENQRAVVMSLDHDLGVLENIYNGPTGYDAVILLIKENFWPHYMVIRSWNPEGARRMAEAAKNFTRVIVSPFKPKSTIEIG